MYQFSFRKPNTSDYIFLHRRWNIFRNSGSICFLVANIELFVVTDSTKWLLSLLWPLDYEIVQNQ